MSVAQAAASLTGTEAPAPVDFGEPLAVDAPQPSVDEMAERLAASFDVEPDAPSVLDEVEVDEPAEGEAVEAADPEVLEALPPDQSLIDELETAQASAAFLEDRVIFHEEREQQWHAHASSVLADNDRLLSQVKAYEEGLRALGYELDPKAEALRNAEMEIARLKAPSPEVKAALEKERQKAQGEAQRKAVEGRWAEQRKAEYPAVQKAYPQLASPVRWEGFLRAYVSALPDAVGKRPTVTEFAADFMGKAQQAAVAAQKTANKTAPRAVHVKQPGAPRSVNSGMPTVDDMAAGLRAAGFAGF